jgi:hypothetical protein
MIAELPKGAMLLADKGYDANGLRDMVTAREAWANSTQVQPQRNPICFSKHLYASTEREPSYLAAVSRSSLF